MTKYLTVYQITPPEIIDIRVTEMYTNITEEDWLLANLKNPEALEEFVVEYQTHKYTENESELRYNELNEQLTVNHQLDAEGFFEELIKINEHTTTI